jgi:hypothetical protein
MRPVSTIRWAVGAFANSTPIAAAEVAALLPKLPARLTTSGPRRMLGMIGPLDAVLWRLGWEPLCTAERGCKNRACELERLLSASAPLAALGHSAVSGVHAVRDCLSRAALAEE